MPNYLNEMGSIKSHGHTKAHCLSELVRTSQITKHDRKPLLSEYRSTGENMLAFFWSKGFELSEINSIWSAQFCGFDRDRKSVKFDQTLLDAWLVAWSRKNKKTHSSIVDHDITDHVDYTDAEVDAKVDAEVEADIMENWIS